MSNSVYQSVHTGAKIDEAISKIPNLEQQINDLDAEVTDAHNSIIKNKNFASLKERFEENEQDFAQHKSAYTNQMPLKADKTYVDNQIAINDARINSLDAEVTDAHNSIVKNKNFASLKERLEESEQDLETHKLDYMPHRIQDLKNNKIYKYSLQMSEDGQPQIIFEEV